MTKEVSILVVGKSGAGKSEFIGSFAANRDLIKASGEGQTTRTNVEYRFSVAQATPQVMIQYLTEENFVNKRLAQIGEVKIPIEEFDESIIEQVLQIDGFFDYTEFDFENNDNSSAIEALWQEILNTLSLEEATLKDTYIPEEYASVKKLLNDKFITKDKKEDLQLSKKREYSLNDIVELFLQATYKICNESIRDFPKTFSLNDLTPDLQEKLTYSLKVNDNKSSTGLIDKVVIYDKISELYEPILQKLKIDTLTFIDTYGLDHYEQLQSDTLSQRYLELFNEYPNIETIFFTRAINSDAPTDLKLAIPAIYHSKPSVVPYLIFTKADANRNIQGQANKSKIDLFALNKQRELKAVQYFMKSKNEKAIKRTLLKENVPIVLINSRYDVLINNLAAYCSLNIEEYQENNIYQVHKLLKSIVNKEHLGTSIVNIDKLRNIVDNYADSNNQIDTLLQLMFDSASKDWLQNRNQSRTIWKNRQQLEEGFLGYDGTYFDSWRSRFLSGYNNAFSKIPQENIYYFEKLFDISWASNEATAIQETLNSFSKYFIDFTHKNVLVQQNLTSFMKLIVHNNPMFNPTSGFTGYKKPIYLWLSEVYNFKNYYDDIKEDIYKLFLEKFFKYFILECREHNTRVLMYECTDITEAEKRLTEYFTTFDTALDLTEQDALKAQVLQYVTSN